MSTPLLNFLGLSIEKQKPIHLIMKSEKDSSELDLVLEGMMTSMERKRRSESPIEQERESADLEVDDIRKRSRSSQQQMDEYYSTRILLKKSEFAKVIGKGGKLIRDIRSKTGAAIKGIDLDDEDRMILISGSTSQIRSAFNEIVEVLVVSYNDYVGMQLREGFSTIPFAVYILIENHRAGKVIGKQGNNIIDLQRDSGASMKLSKEATDRMGVMARVLVIEGSSSQIRKGHGMVADLFDRGGDRDRDRDRDRDGDREWGGGWGWA